MNEQIYTLQAPEEVKRILEVCDGVGLTADDLELMYPEAEQEDLQ